MPSIYDELGVRTIINCATTYTRIGGSIMDLSVAQSMADAAGAFVDIPELIEAVGKRLAVLTSNESAYVSNGAAAGLTIATAAAICGEDPAKAAKLPIDMDGLKNEVVVHRVNRIWYDQAVRNAGARLIEIGHVYETQAWELDAAINERTAAVLYAAGAHLNRNSLPLEYVVERAHAHGIPVIVDAAAQVPPLSNLTYFTREMGVDVAIFSGGKNLRGPQNSGLVVGTEAMIRAMRFNGPPNQRFARNLKVGKETMIGLLKAVERYVNLDHAVLWDEWSAVVDSWSAAWSGIADIHRLNTNEAGEPIPRLIMSFADKPARDAYIADLRAGTPQIAVVLNDDRSIAFSPHLLQPGEAEIVRTKVLEMAAISMQI
ncbi:MAG TPA: aminotransferase class V-fold PLP-dependent enzyme [Thermomicrobiales bacterium]|nr:aminotransferase class V-fold PLP-dependent enzyme [Thermomicrobiales bacterium]